MRYFDEIKIYITNWWWNILNKEDENGYLLNRKNKLVHREIAYEYIYRKQKRDEYPLRFRDYVIHHCDRNKKNNSLSNLRILTREEHDAAHRKGKFKKK